MGTGSFLDVQPGAGTEWSIFKFQGEAEFEVYKTDGTNFKLIVPAGPANTPAVVSDPGGPFRLTNGVYYRVKNVNAGTKFLGADGIQTK